MAWDGLKQRVMGVMVQGGPALAQAGALAVAARATRHRNAGPAMAVAIPNASHAKGQATSGAGHAMGVEAGKNRKGQGGQPSAL